LQALYEELAPRGLVVLAFPCNQFGSQEPGTNSEIYQFATQKYGATFPIFAKICVNGSKTDPLWRFLKLKTKATFGQSIKWNFTKFLIGRDGVPVDRFAPTSDPFDIKPQILGLLDQ